MKVLDISEQFSWLTCERLDQEAGLANDFEPPNPPKWIGFGLKSNEQHVIQSNYVRSLPRMQIVGDLTIDLDPSVEQFQFAMSLSYALNKEIAYDGSWLVAWTHPPHVAEALRVNPRLEWRRLVMIFLDKDGDPQFTVDSVRIWPDVAASGILHFVDQCQQAIEQWKMQLKVLDLKADQSIMLAKGGR